MWRKNQKKKCFEKVDDKEFTKKELMLIVLFMATVGFVISTGITYSKSIKNKTILKEG